MDAYIVSEENYAQTSNVVISGREASVAVSHGALLVCYWFLSFSAVRIARKREVVEAARVATAQHDSAGRTGLPGSTTSTYAPVPSHSNTTQTPKHTPTRSTCSHTLPVA